MQLHVETKHCDVMEIILKWMDPILSKDFFEIIFASFMFFVFVLLGLDKVMSYLGVNVNS